MTWPRSSSREAVARAGIDPALIDEVILGGANQAGEDNRNVARMAVLLAGFPDHVPGITVNRLCASGLSAITMAAQAIRAGDADLIVAGGVESMTRAPWVQAKPEKAFAKPGAQFDTSIGWRFVNPRTCRPRQGDLLDAGDRRRGRAGVRDQPRGRRCVRSRESPAGDRGHGRGPIRRGDRRRSRRRRVPCCSTKGPRRDTQREILAGLRPVVKGGTVVTAGNSSALNDGASAVVVASAEAVEEVRPACRAPRRRRGERGRRARGHGHRPGAGDSEGARPQRADGRRPRLDRTQRGVRDPVARRHPRARISTPPASTPMAGRSRSGIRWARAARGWSSRCSVGWSARTRATGSRRCASGSARAAH